MTRYKEKYYLCVSASLWPIDLATETLRHRERIMGMTLKLNAGIYLAAKIGTIDLSLLPDFSIVI
jgi:hypothetical protein